MFYWKPEVCAPYDTQGDMAWDASTRKPTAIMSGFKNA
jgi:arabinogalactan endo-1,4-beta-galactosidase